MMCRNGPMSGWVCADDPRQAARTGKTRNASRSLPGRGRVEPVDIDEGTRLLYIQSCTAVVKAEGSLKG